VHLVTSFFMVKPSPLYLSQWQVFILNRCVNYVIASSLLRILLPSNLLGYTYHKSFGPILRSIPTRSLDNTLKNWDYINGPYFSFQIIREMRVFSRMEKFMSKTWPSGDSSTFFHMTWFSSTWCKKIACNKCMLPYLVC